MHPSRLATVPQDTSVSPSVDTMRDVSRAIHEATAARTACHAALDSNLVPALRLKTTLAQAGPVWRSRSSESLRRS
jgi:hypothetical protein